MVKHWVVWALLSIIMTGLAVRLILIPFEKPVELDAISYLKLAIDLSFYGILPKDVAPLHNMGFPVFLSFLFKPFDNDFVFLSNIQRITTAILSTATIPVIYLICKRFFSTKYSLIGAGLFAFDFRIIQNSSFGITEPLFLLLSFSGFALIFKAGRLWGFLAIILVGLSIVVRIEGVLMLIVVCIIYFHRYSISYKSIVHMIAVLAILFVPTLLIIDMNLDNGNPDGFISKFDKEFSYFQSLIQQSDTLPRLANSLIYMGWATFPNYILFLPLGIYWIVKNQKHLWLIGAMALLLVSGVWAYIDAYDTRYFFQSYVIIILISLAGIQYLDDKLFKKWCNV